MEITVTVPDDLSLLPPDQEPARAALEAIGLEAYRERRITAYQLRLLLGISSRYQLDGFLKQHDVYDYTAEDFVHDLTAICERGEGREPEQTA